MTPTRVEEPSRLTARGLGPWGRAITALGLLLSTTFVMLFGLDRLMDRFDIGYRARRSAPNASVTIERSEFKFQVTTNALGFRERRLPGPKPPGTFRIVAVGDSFTQGYGVAEEEAFPCVLERLLQADDPSRRYEVVNLGVPSTNPRDYDGNLSAVGLAYEPDLVLVVVGANDVHDVKIQPRTGSQFGWERLMRARAVAKDEGSFWTGIPGAVFPALYPFARERAASLFEGLARADEEGEPPSGAAVRRPSTLRWQDVLLALADEYGRRPDVAARLDSIDPARAERARGALLGEVVLGSEEGEDAYWTMVALVQPDMMSDAVLLPSGYDAAWGRVADRLHRIVRRAHAAEADVVMTLIPDQHQVAATGKQNLERLGFRWNPRTLVDTTFNDRVRAVATEEQILFVDLLTPLRAHAPEGLYFPRDGHMTAAGNGVVAEILADAIREAIRQSTPSAS